VPQLGKAIAEIGLEEIERNLGHYADLINAQEEAQGRPSEAAGSVRSSAPESATHVCPAPASSMTLSPPRNGIHPRPLPWGLYARVKDEKCTIERLSAAENSESAAPSS
jgi:hypothetical protein